MIYNSPTGNNNSVINTKRNGSVSMPMGGFSRNESQTRPDYWAGITDAGNKLRQMPAGMSANERRLTLNRIGEFGALSGARSDEQIKSSGASMGLSPAAINAQMAQAFLTNRGNTQAEMTGADLSIAEQRRQEAARNAMASANYAMQAGQLGSGEREQDLVNERFNQSLQEQIAARLAREKLDRDQFAFSKERFGKEFEAGQDRFDRTQSLNERVVGNQELRDEFDRMLQQQGLDIYMDDRTYNNKLRDYMMFKEFPELGFENPFANMNARNRNIATYPGGGGGQSTYGVR